MGPFHQMAARLAEEEKDEEKDEDEQFKARWMKAKGIVQQKVKPAVQDLEQAIKDEDEKLTKYLYERMLELMVQLSKSFGMRDFTSKLQTLERKTFD
jgi:hypothetical protein